MVGNVFGIFLKTFKEYVLHNSHENPPTININQNDITIQQV